MGNKFCIPKSKKSTTKDSPDKNMSQEARQIFDKYDDDNSGKLDYKEIQKALMELSGDFKVSPSEEEVMAIIVEMDTDGDKELRFGFLDSFTWS